MATDTEYPRPTMQARLRSWMVSDDRRHQRVRPVRRGVTTPHILGLLRSFRRCFSVCASARPSPARMFTVWFKRPPDRLGLAIAHICACGLLDQGVATYLAVSFLAGEEEQRCAIWRLVSVGLMLLPRTRCTRYTLHISDLQA
ncbi:hypothetical protein BV20DRAFT_523268 [Pilatotrama ljubarskyi]|nr:hypothetical protein BV20DRAFT_523268 [Pilatotrama ljubarskyi]